MNRSSARNGRWTPAATEYSAGGQTEREEELVGGAVAHRLDIDRLPSVSAHAQQPRRDGVVINFELGEPAERLSAKQRARSHQQRLFEAANPRHEHEWTVWRDAKLPDAKILAPGLIDTCSNYVEHPELIAQQIERFAAIVSKDRVIASTDCGFGTFAGYGKIDPGVTWKKLRALREGAEMADARL